MKHQAQPLPPDVRLMNGTATVLFAACALLLVAALGWWALRHPVFAIGGIVVQGDVAHNSAATLRANVAPKLSGNFFTVDLKRAREAFESVPWVRQAVVKRQFPNRLRVQLQEHQPEAFWGADAESRLVNTQGEVFEANPGDVEQDDIPRLVGPEGNYDYQNKYFTDDTQYLVPCGLPQGEEAAIQELVLKAYRVLGCRGWGRIDVMIDAATRRPSLLEINTSPGMTGHSLVPMSARAAGISYEDLCLQLLAGASLDQEGAAK